MTDADKTNSQVEDTAGKINYKITDAVAFMPLMIGFRPAGRNDDLGLIDPLSTFRPPSANIIQQSWKLHNTQTLDLVFAAMRKCNTSCLFALDTYDGGENFYVKAHKLVDEIEEKVKGILVTSNLAKKEIVDNMASLRLNTYDALSVKLKMSEGTDPQNLAKEFIKQNSLATEIQMRKIFDIPNCDSKEWAGLNEFNSFWDKIVTMSEDTRKTLDDTIKAQEKYEIETMCKSVHAYHELYKLLYVQLNKKTLKGDIQTKYLNGIYEENIPKNTKVEFEKKRADAFLEKYLWNALLERFEILDSLVSSLFSLVCATRNIHVPLVRKFMEHAILYCSTPLITCISKPPTVHKSKNETSIQEIYDGFNHHKTEFSNVLGSLFTGGSALATKPLTSSGKNQMKAHMFERLLQTKDKKTILLGPRLEVKERTELYTAIEKSIEKKFTEISSFDLKACIFPETRDSKGNILPAKIPKAHGILKAYTASDDKKNPVKLINQVLNLETSVKTCIQAILYSRIYADSVSFGVFHYEDNNADAVKTYFAKVSNPMKIKYDSKSDTGEPDLSKGRRVAAKDDGAFATAMPATLQEKLVLKPDFKPEVPKSPSNQAQNNQNNNNKQQKKNQNKNNQKKKNKQTSPKGRPQKGNNRSPKK